jgi:hypothetical protein
MQDNKILELWGPTGTWPTSDPLFFTFRKMKKMAGWLAVKRECRVACAGLFNLDYGKDDFGRMPILLQPVLQIHKILGWIWIRGFMPPTIGSGSGSCYFRR